LLPAEGDPLRYEWQLATNKPSVRGEVALLWVEWAEWLWRAFLVEWLCGSFFFLIFFLIFCFLFGDKTIILQWQVTVINYIMCQLTTEKWYLHFLCTTITLTQDTLRCGPVCRPHPNVSCVSAVVVRTMCKYHFSIGIIFYQLIYFLGDQLFLWCNYGCVCVFFFFFFL